MEWLAGSRESPTAADLRGVASFDAVFAEVEADRAFFGVVPIEHSSSGSLHAVYDCLLKSPLCIVGELGMVEEHCLVRGACPCHSAFFLICFDSKDRVTKRVRACF
jgi:prephenate dehydratase